MPETSNAHQFFPITAATPALGFAQGGRTMEEGDIKSFNLI